jgi:ubiquinone/menaquinone biosynthesis C-methylase UbiE
MSVYTDSATVYDAINQSRGKDYAAESRKIHTLIIQHQQSSGRALLDVACGTGGHLAHLRKDYQVEGMDLSGEMLAVARQRYPNIPLHQANMLDFDLQRQYDAVVCLFSSIGYVQTVENLRRAIAAMSRHLVAGGVLIIEPWLAPEQYVPGTLHATYVNQPDLKVARMSISQQKGRISVMEYHFLVATSQGIEHFSEENEMGLFTTAEYRAAFEAAGLTVHHDAEGLIGRGLFVGVKH